MKILHLTLKKKWFDMIDSGEKTEEYREIKIHWAFRLLYKIYVPWGGYLWPWSDIEKGDYDCSNWTANGGPPIFRKIDIISATNGYGKDRPSWSRKCLGITIGEGRQEWGAEPGKKYFVIKLGEKIY